MVQRVGYNDKKNVADYDKIVKPNKSKRLDFNSQNHFSAKTYTTFLPRESTCSTCQLGALVT